MKTEKKRQQGKVNLFNRTFKVSHFFSAVLLAVLAVIVSKPASAHCDSYDGPVIIDARKALETNNPEPVLKWISKKQEKEVISLFNKTVALKNGDRGEASPRNRRCSLHRTESARDNKTNYPNERPCTLNRQYRRFGD